MRFIRKIGKINSLQIIRSNVMISRAGAIKHIKSLFAKKRKTPFENGLLNSNYDSELQRNSFSFFILSEKALIRQVN